MSDVNRPVLPGSGPDLPDEARSDVPDEIRLLMHVHMAQAAARVMRANGYDREADAWHEVFCELLAEQADRRQLARAVGDVFSGSDSEADDGEAL